MRKCLDWLFCLSAFLAVLFIALLGFPLCLGIYPRIVLSGSMEPGIPVGSIAYVDSRIPAEEIRELDVISYCRAGKLHILHRVVRLEQGQNRFLTKGDANGDPDLGTVDFAQYEGKEVFSIPYLGYAVHFLQTGNNRALLFGFFFLLAAADCVWKYREGRRDRGTTERRIGNGKTKISEKISGKKENG